MLLSAGYELPRQLFIHGMLAGHDGHRMSKTRGNAMDYRPAAEAYGVDALRYYLLREVGFGQDGGVGYAGMHERYHGELANELGNLVSRSAAMVERYREGVIPTVPASPELAALAAEVAEGYEHRFEHLDFTGALERVWELVRALNRYVESRAPWELAKSGEPEAVAALDETLATLCEGVRVLAVLLWPYLPGKAPQMLAAVGEAGDDVGFERAALASGSGQTVDRSAGSLFPRIDAHPE
jgi:methionyl-tRNA synthetase